MRRMGRSYVCVKFPIAPDKLKQQVTDRDRSNYIVEHLPIADGRDYSRMIFLEEPTIFLLDFILEADLAPFEQPVIEPLCKQDVVHRRN